MSADPYDWRPRLANYAVQLPQFPPALFVAGDGRLVGTLFGGQNYASKTKYYGAYPGTYLKRMRALFHGVPGKRLHLFSGMVDLSELPGDTVDVQPHLNPTYVDDATELLNVPLSTYRLVFADPPYSYEDAEHYGPPMISRNKVMSALRRLPSGAEVVWLDQALPMFRKDDWAITGAVGWVRSTNHRFRMITFFRRK